MNYSRYKRHYGNFAVGLANTVDSLIDVKNRRIRRK